MVFSSIENNTKQAIGMDRRKARKSGLTDKIPSSGVAAFSLDGALGHASPFHMTLQRVTILRTAVLQL